MQGEPTANRENDLAPQAVAGLPRVIQVVVQVVVKTHAEYLELQPLRAAHQGRIKLPVDSEPVVHLTFAEYQPLMAKSKKQSTTFT